MIRPTLPHIQWIGFLTIALATGLLLILSRCENHPIIAPFPGSQWTFQDTVIFTMDDSSFARTPSHGGSHTLYTGLIDEDEPAPRESGILVKFASVDSSRLANFRSARLVLFRRTFGDEPLEPEVSFALYTIDEPDTTWAESDTAGHTIMDSLVTGLKGTACMSRDSIAIPSGDSTIIRTDLEYLEFEVNSTTLSEWREGQVANNGFLIRQEDQGALVGFHSGESNGISPFLALTITDTASTEGDTTYYKWSTADLSIYPSPNLDFDPTDSDSLLHLDYSSGLRSHIYFSDPDTYFSDPDTTGIIAGARLVLHVNRDVDVPPIVADSVDIQVLRRAKPLAEGDSTEVLISSVIYQKGSDNLVLKLGGFLSGVTAGAYKNYGLDLVVKPNNHDFDHLVFWGACASDSLKRPRLEVIYGLPYVGVP